MLLVTWAGNSGAQVPNKVRSGELWIAGRLSLGSTVLNSETARPWEAIGQPGASVGGVLSLGYDRRQLGGALDIDLASQAVGSRRGSNLGLAATLRWRPEWRPMTDWEPTVSLGFMRLGVGGVRVSSSQLPAGVFRSGAVGAAGATDKLTLIGNGLRTALAVERRLGTKANLVIGLGLDAVYFDTAAYQGYDESLASPGWGLLPRIEFGIRVIPLGRVSRR